MQSILAFILTLLLICRVTAGCCIAHTPGNSQLTVIEVCSLAFLEWARHVDGRWWWEVGLVIVGAVLSHQKQMLEG